MHYQTLLFDADGTLLDFHKTEAEALKTTFARHSIPLTEAVRQRYLTINHNLWTSFERGQIDKNTVVYTRFQRLFDSLGLEADGIQFEEEYQSHLGEGGFIIDGALALCAKLSQQHNLYIVTNGVARTQYSRLKSSGLSAYMKDIFVSEDAGYQKPQKEYFDYVFQRIPGLTLSKTLIIGDSLASDMKGGNNAGIDTCWYNPQGQKNDTDSSVTIEIKQLEELYQYI